MRGLAFFQAASICNIYPEILIPWFLKEARTSLSLMCLMILNYSHVGEPLKHFYLGLAFLGGQGLEEHLCLCGLGAGTVATTTHCCGQFGCGFCRPESVPETWDAADPLGLCSFQ